jgi:hypothetical protein
MPDARAAAPASGIPVLALAEAFRAGVAAPLGHAPPRRGRFQATPAPDLLIIDPAWVILSYAA